jgi:hypothetical protein
MGDYPIGKIALYLKAFGWMTSWELNSEVLGSPWLKASVIGEAGRPPFELYPGICLTSEEKHGKSLGSRVAIGLLVAPTWLSFEGLPRLAC